ncbi:MAG: hypothetical protein M3R10_02190 [Verrucomicrobiota bacterium]|nr:hypothetical protein [Verrucomicrobiota bacterium]
MNENPAAPVPPNAGSGCCGMGCATLLALIAFFAIAFVGGGVWAIHHYKNKYTSPEPMKLPEVSSSEESSAAESSTSPSTPAAPNSTAATPVPVKRLSADWKAFEKAGKRNEKAQIALTAAQINSLLQNDKNTSGRAYVTIENNVARVRLSIPLKNVPMMKGRYLNGEGTVKASADGDPGKAEITNIVLSGETVPDSVLDQRILGMKSLRSAIGDWLDKQNIESFRIENNTVISETRGQ